MALRGETIGRAYVKILADGSGLPQSIRDEMEKTEPIMESSGRRDSEAYAKGFENEFKKVSGRKVANAMNTGVGKSDALEKYFNSPKWKQQLNRLEREFGDVGVLIGHNIEEGVRGSGDLGQVETRLKNIGGEITRAQNTIRKGNEDWERDFRRELARTDAVMGNVFRDMVHNSERVSGAFQKMRTGLSGLGRELDRDTFSFFRRFTRDLQGSEGTVGNWFTRIGNKADLAGNKIGKAFGKGSRNNFVNFMAGFVQAPVELFARVAEGIGSVADEANRLKGVFSGAGGGFEGLQAVGAEVWKPLTSNVLALGGALAGMYLIIGPLAGLISSVAAAIVALGAAVSFALGAGLGVLVGLMAPLALGLGTVALAFMGMSDDVKKSLKESLKPAIDEFHNLQEAARGGIVEGIKGAGDDIAGAFEKLTPLIKDVSAALGGVIGTFAEAANSKGFQDFISGLRDTIPQALTTMGDIALDVFRGIGGIIAGVMPATQEFLGWLAGIAQQFGDWATSVGGQTQIADFMERAGQSAQQLWDLLTKVGEALGLILFNEDARKGGGTILESMTASVQSFIDYLKANPDAIRNWIGDGVEMAKNLGRAIEGITKVFVALDTPQNRELANKVIGGLVIALQATAVIARVASGAATAFGRILGAIPFLGTIADLIRLAGRFTALLPALRTAGSAIATFASNMWQRIRDGVARAGTWLASLPGKVTAQVGRMRAGGAALADSLIAGLRSLIGKAENLVSELIGVFKGLGSRIVSAIGGIHINWPTPPKWFTSLPGVPGAAGDLVWGPQVRLVGEAGPEAIVPLNRPLNQVDPAVRALSAVAQGKAVPMTGAGGRSVNVGGLTIITPTKDPAAVARETVNRLVAAAYI